MTLPHTCLLLGPPTPSAFLVFLFFVGCFLSRSSNVLGEWFFLKRGPSGSCPKRAVSLWGDLTAAAVSLWGLPAEGPALHLGHSSRLGQFTQGRAQ